MKRPQELKALAFLLSLSLFAAGSTFSAEGSERPNILIILADDLGYSDLGCYGGEIDTPYLDKLANNGLRFTQFYNTAKCHSSRISLLTGRYPFQAGNKAIDRTTTLAENLGSCGYFTAMVGKWHLDQEPQDFGFERYFGHLSGATNYFRGNDTWRLDREPYPIPESGFYATTAKADYALTFLDEARQTKKPWFLYMAFNAPHAPLQPLKEDYEKYLGKYDQGWDKIYAQRIEKQKRLKLFGEDVEPPARPYHIPSWEDLSDVQRDFERRRGAAYAALVDRLDKEIGRVIDSIEEHGELENTLILFLSDNGACPYDRPSPGKNREPYARGASWNDSTGWAWARNAPFRLYKQNQHEGGSSTPAILHWPAGLATAPGSTNASPLHLVDIAPTLAEITQSEVPDAWPSRDLMPVAGESFASILRGEEARERGPIYLQFAADRGLRHGDWKIVSFHSQPWELYNIAQDRTELHNLAETYPDRLASMAQTWQSLSDEYLMPKRLSPPVATKSPEHNHHWEWSDYRSDPNTTMSEASAKRENPSRKKPKAAK